MGRISGVRYWAEPTETDQDFTVGCQDSYISLKCLKNISQSSS